MRTKAELQRFMAFTKKINQSHRKILVEDDLVPLHKPLVKQVKGRGYGSHRSGFCGRGARGRNRHRAHRKRHFCAGGNTPFYRTVRKHGFANPLLTVAPHSEINLDDIQTWIDRGIIDPNYPIDMGLLVRARALESCKDGVKLVGSDDTKFNAKISIVVSQASLEAIRIVEQCGGKIECRYHSMDELQLMSHPQSFIRKGGLPLPELPNRPQLRAYYSNPMYRGYLAHSVDKPIHVLFQDSHLLNQEKMPLPQNLSLGKRDDPDELKLYATIQDLDYDSQYQERKRFAEIRRRGTNEFARRLLSADAVKETAV